MLSADSRSTMVRNIPYGVCLGMILNSKTNNSITCTHVIFSSWLVSRAQAHSTANVLSFRSSHTHNSFHFISVWALQGEISSSRDTVATIRLRTTLTQLVCCCLLLSLLFRRQSSCQYGFLFCDFRELLRHKNTHTHTDAHTVTPTSLLSTTSTKKHILFCVERVHLRAESREKERGVKTTHTHTHKGRGKRKKDFSFHLQ